MSTKKNDFFWPSYTDLMTSLFFVMLVLYVLTYVRLNKTIKLQRDQLAIIHAVQENLKPLQNDTTLFTYEEKFKRFKLSFDVKFAKNQFEIVQGQLMNYDETIKNIDRAGNKLMATIDTLKKLKEESNNKKVKDISYILIIAGYASRTGLEYHNYELSYQRALALRNYWKSVNLDFEDIKYDGLIDLQISGNGWGGVGRLTTDETANQRFLIQIFPKIGDTKE